MNSKKNRSLILSLVCLICFALSSYWVSVPKPNLKDTSSFSPQLVEKDIEAISGEPRSLLHPEARQRARLYLENRLEQLGGKVETFHYDSVALDSLNVDLANVLATWEPQDMENSSSYLMMIAHYDSSNKKRRTYKENLSQGAADNGYGVGIALELVRLANEYRSTWNQGVKILFTDGEEFKMLGMHKALEKNPEIFDNVGFVINIEARGVKGPALLFETSPNNEKIIELYSKASQPFTYSLTSTIYNFLPNYTDFQLVKGTIPGINVAVIDDLWYYHSKFDVPENIDLGSIQHYGDQLTPITKEYLTNSKYSSTKQLKGERDMAFFTIPIIGIIKYSETLELIVTIMTSILLTLIVGIYLKREPYRLKTLLYKLLRLLIKAVIASIQALAIVLIYAYATSRDYKLISMVVTKWDLWVAFLSIFAIFTQLLLTFKLKKHGSSKRLPFYLMGAVISLTVWSILIHIYLGNNFFTLIPVMVSLPTLLLNIAAIESRVWIRVASISAIIIIIITLAPFITSLIIALGIGALPIVVIPAYFAFITLIPLGETFINE
ncbi:MAG: M28 family peptidase [Bacteroidales bacterium]